PGHTIFLGLELRIFEDQYASDWNSNAAEWRLAERFLFGSIQKDLSPRLGIDLHAHIKRDHRSRRFVAVDDVRHPPAQASVAIFESMRAAGQLERYGSGSNVGVIFVDIDCSGRTDCKRSTHSRNNTRLRQLCGRTLTDQRRNRGGNRHRRLRSRSRAWDVC